MSTAVADGHWSTRGLCRRHPDAWAETVFVGGVIAAHNAAALRTCLTACPVREKCQSQGEKQHPTERAQQIIGGVAYDRNGQPFPTKRVDDWLARAELPTGTPEGPRSGRRPKNNLQPCGTPAAYARHRNKGEEPCGPCGEAMRANRSEYRALIRERKARRAEAERAAQQAQQAKQKAARAAANATLSHGTASAIRRHIAHGELLCDTCSAVADELAGAMT